jgi:hypothetical protein
MPCQLYADEKVCTSIPISRSSWLTHEQSLRTLEQHDPDRLEDLDTAGEDHVADETRYACMSRPYIADKIVKPKSDRIEVMVNTFGQVSYVREGEDGKTETVDIRDVVREHCRRKECERRREAW